MNAAPGERASGGPPRRPPRPRGPAASELPADPDRRAQPQAPQPEVLTRLLERGPVSRTKPDERAAAVQRAQSDQYLVAAVRNCDDGLHVPGVGNAHDAARLAIAAALTHLGLRIDPRRTDDHRATIEAFAVMVGEGGRGLARALQDLRTTRDETNYAASMPDDSAPFLKVARLARERVTVALRDVPGWPPEWPPPHE